MENEYERLVARTGRHFPTGIGIDGGVVDFLPDLEAVVSDPRGRELTKAKHRASLSKTKANLISIPEDYLIRVLSIRAVLTELSDELRIPLQIIPLTYLIPDLIEKFASALSEEERGIVRNERYDIYRITVGPGEVVKPRLLGSTQLSQVIGGVYKNRGRLYGAGHQFMKRIGEEQGYDNIGFKTPLEILSVSLP